MSLKDFFKNISKSFTASSAGPGFNQKIMTLPNNGGSYSSPVPNMSLNSSAPKNDFGSVNYVDPKIGIRSLYGDNGKSDFAYPQRSETTPPAGGSGVSIFKEEKGANAPIEETVKLDYTKYLNPKTGKPYSPKEYADLMASRATSGMIPNYAGDTITKNMGVDELAKRGRELNNARNDIATGEKDPYKIASRSGLQYSPVELSAIEKAYSGIFDPALNDVFVKLERAQKIEDSERESENKLKEMAKKFEYDVALKKTPSGDAMLDAENSAGGGTGEFAATVALVSNMEPSVYGKKTIAQQLRGLIDAKDYAGAYNQIANTIENGLVGESKQRYVNSRTDLGVMQRMEDAIKTYAAGGGDMGLLVGTEEEIKRKLGIDSGKASALATQLWREFQVYRNNMTGAAFGANESRDYASVNPTLKKSLDLNLSVLEGAKNQLRNRVYETIDTRVPSAKYIREYAEGAVPGQNVGGGGRSSVISKDGQSFDASTLTDEEYRQALTDGYLPQ